MLAHYCIIGLGGALGAIARAFISTFIPASIGALPLPILVVNIVGCILMGIVVETGSLVWSLPSSLRTFLTTGFLGGFTTFSAFALEWGLLQEKGLSLYGALYVLLSVTLSLMGFMGGMRLVRLVAFL